MAQLDREDHAIKAAALSTILMGVLSNMLDDGEIDEPLYILAQEITDHAQAAIAPDMARMAALDALRLG